MMALVRDTFRGGLTPDFHARAAVEAEDHELVRCVRVGDAKHALRLVLGPWQGRIDLACVDGGQQEDLVAPDDRDGIASAGDRHLPLDVPGFAPFDRRRGGTGKATRFRSAPLMPLMFDLLGRNQSRGRRHEGADQEKEEK